MEDVQDLRGYKQRKSHATQGSHSSFADLCGKVKMPFAIFYFLQTCREAILVAYNHIRPKKLEIFS